VSESLQVGLGRIELEDVEEGEKGVESSVVVDVHCPKGVHVYSCIVEYLSVVLAGDVIHDIFLVETGGQQRVIEGE
jgi:hypothetical protein